MANFYDCERFGESLVAVGVDMCTCAVPVHDKYCQVILDKRDMQVLNIIAGVLSYFIGVIQTYLQY